MVDFRSEDITLFVLAWYNRIGAENLRWKGSKLSRERFTAVRA